MSNSIIRSAAAEAIGTGLLVFIGLGAVHAAVLTAAQQGIWQVAVVWGLGIAAAVYATAHISGAHLNPAVTVALATWRRFPWRNVPIYIVSQTIGAFCAAALLFVLFEPHHAKLESDRGVVRGQPGSELTAMCFGEYFPSPGRLDATKPYTLEEHLELEKLVSPFHAFIAEMIATAILVIVIFAVGDSKNSAAPQSNAAPVIIGLTVACLISIFAPLTQACFNPARDFGPRVLACLAGWGDIAFKLQGTASWLTVYIVAPILGAVIGGGIYQGVLSSSDTAQRVE